MSSTRIRNQSVSVSLRKLVAPDPGYAVSFRVDVFPEAVDPDSDCIVTVPDRVDADAAGMTGKRYAKAISRTGSGDRRAVRGKAALDRVVRVLRDNK